MTTVLPLTWTHLGSDWRATTAGGHIVGSIHWQSDSGHTFSCAPSFAHGSAISLDAAKEQVEQYWETFVRTLIT